MRYVLAIAAAVFALPAEAVICSDGVSRATASNLCPAYLYDGATSAVDTDSASIDGYNDTQGIGATRYIYVSTSAYPPGCTSANYTYPADTAEERLAMAQCTRHDLIKSGSGASVHTSETLVYDGQYLKVVSGLSSGTTYYAHSQAHGGACDPYPNYTLNCRRPGAISLVQTVAFTTDTAGGGGGDPGDEELVDDAGAARFIGAGGNDLSDGLTHANRWLTLSKVTCSLASGTNIGLLNTTTFTEEILDVCYAGSSGDWNIIGSYKLNGSSQPIWSIDGVMGTGTTDTKAVIKGSLTASCISARTCTYPTTGFPLGGMTSIYDSPVTIDNRGDYTELRNIEVSYTRYGTVHFYGSGSGSPGSLNHVILDGIDVPYTGHQAPIVGTDGVQDVVIRNSSAYTTSTCFTLKQSPKSSSDTSACESAGSPYWPVGFIQITRSPNSRVLAEYNEGTRMFGEGIGWYNNSNSYSIWRHNRIMNTHSDNYFVDGSGHVVVENNIGVGGNGSMDASVDTGNGAFSCVHIGTESVWFPNTVGTVVRNNLCVGGGSGVNVNMFPDAISGGDLVGAKIYGNTHIAQITYDHWQDVPVASTSEWVVTGNLHWSSLGAGGCLNVYNAGVWLDNHWPSDPSDSGCDGTGDTYGDPGLTESSLSTWTTLNNQNGSSPTWPTSSQANPAGGSAVLGTGTALTSSILNITDYGFAWTQIAEVLDGTLTEAEWECALCVDAEGATRANPPSKGAVE